MAGKPSTQFYPGDWWRAVDLRKCCMATQGIWFNMLLVMWDEQKQGKIKGTRVEICRVVGCQLIELRKFIEDNKVHKFADVTLGNKYVTVINRRMYAAYIEREGTKLRVQQYRKRKSNADVTLYSSTSTSTSKEKNNKKEIFDRARKYYPGEKRGLETEFTYFCETHKDWEEVLPLLLPAIKSEEDRRAQLMGANKFVPSWKHFKTWTYTRCWEITAGQTITTEEKTANEQRSRAKKRQEIRQEYSQFYHEKTTEELRKMLNNKTLIAHWWLIKEILAKRKGNG